MNRYLVCVLAIVLGGCAALAERPAPTVIAPATFDVPRLQPAPRQLLVALPTSSAVLDSERVLSRPQPGLYAHLAGVAWPDTPSRILQDQLVKALQRSGGWRAVERQGSGLRGERVLNISLHRFELDYSGQPVQAQLEWVATLVDSRNGEALAQRRFVADSVVSDTGAAAAARSLAGLLAEQIIELVEWLSAVESAAA